MNPDDRLTDALDDIAGAAGRSTSHLTDDELVAGVRRRATVLRKRRATTRSLVATASAAAIAVTGWGVARSLGDTAPPPPATPAACASTFAETTTTGPITLVGPEADPDEPTVWVLSEQIEETFLRNVTYVPVSFVANMSVGHVLVRDGVVVGATTTLGATTHAERLDSQMTTRSLTPSPMTMCDDAPLAPGTYQLYPFTDITLGTATGATTRVWGEASTIRIGTPDPAVTAMQLACGAPIDQLPWAVEDAASSLTVGIRPRLRAHLARPAVRAGTSLDAGLTVGVDGPVLGERAETYLVRDGIVVAALSSDPTGAAWRTPGTDPDWPGTAEVPLLDGPLRPTVPGTSCSTGAPLTSGDYDVVVILPVAVGFQVEIAEIVDAGRLTVVDGEAPAASPLSAPVCGMPVVAPPRIEHEPEIELDGASADRIGAPVRGVAGRDDRPLPVNLVALNGPDRTLTYRSALRPVLLRDGVVVALGATTPVTTDAWRIPEASPEQRTALHVKVAEIEPCPGTTVDDGPYTALATLDATLTVGGTSTDILVHGGPWEVSFDPADAATDRSTYVPGCSEVLADVLPTDAGTRFTLAPYALGATPAPLVARTSELEDGFWSLRLSLSTEDGAGLVASRTMLVVSRDGRSVLGHGSANDENLTLGEPRDLWSTVGLVGCDDEPLPAGTYDLTAVVTVTTPDGPTSVVRTWPLEIVTD